MTLLLDTRIWLWLNSDLSRLSGDFVERFRRERPRPRLSVASAWEIAIKHRSGRLALPGDPEQWVPQRLRDSRVDLLDVRLAHVLAAGALPLHHRDPFDRLLVAQAQLEGSVLVTVDRAMGAYDVELLDPRP